MTALRARAAGAIGCLAVVTLGLTACGSPPPAGPQKPSVATSAAEVGGMNALIAAARREGALRAMALPRDWANYGALIDDFEKKYGIEVTVDSPDAHSEEEVDALEKGGGRATTPDVIDLGDTFARMAEVKHLLAPYKVAVYDSIPDYQKSPHGHWYNNYGGYVSIGCDANRVKPCPETFADLLKPGYKGKIALEGSPTEANSAFSSVYAAALANGGSFDDIQPGLDFFAELSRRGNFDPVESTSSAVANGRTPVSINWDFLNLGYADRLRSKGMDWHVSIPFDGSFAQYYAQAINKHARHPAAARLWEEYLFSVRGQNLRLYGYARPVLMDVMKKDGTLDKAGAARLPTVEGTPRFPTDDQLAKAQDTVDRGWAKAVSR
ncbi:ABC transporter substrate-binding protein [Streptomyces sp. NPDC055722]